MSLVGIVKVFEQHGCGDDAIDMALVPKVLTRLCPEQFPDLGSFQLLLDVLKASKGREPSTLKEVLEWILEDSSRPEVVFVLGGPGSGKGTFSARLVEQYGFKHLSAGDLIRAERARPGSDMAKMIEDTISAGKLLPSEVTVGLIEHEMRRCGWDGSYLVDGFPRSIENYGTWERLLGARVNLRFCFIIDCSMDVMEQRLLNRGKSSGRSDDNIVTIRKRFTTFLEESVPVQEMMENRGIARKVSSDPGIDAVWPQVEAIFSERPSVVFVLGGPGCGKGTFSARLVQQYGFRHLSAGDLIRAERARPGSEVAKLIEERISAGKLIPSEITVGLIADEMRRCGWGGLYLIDGFPRSIENYDTWENILGNTVDLKFSFIIDCSMDVMEQRLLNRGKTSGRSDDNLETIQKRFVTFREESVPVQEQMEKRGTVRKVSSDPGIDVVWHQVEAIFSGFSAGK